MVSSCPPYPMLRVLDSSRMWFMPLNPFNKCFRAAARKEKPFFARKWPKNANIYPKSVFSGSGWSVGARPLPSFLEGAGSEAKMCCMPLQQFHNTFTAILPYLCRSGQKISNVQNVQFDIKLNELTTCCRILH